MNVRILPSQINTGDTIRLELALPQPPEGESWSRANLDMRRIRDTEVTILAENDSTIVENMAVIEVPAATTATMVDGVYRYAITCTTGTTVITLENGVVDIKNALDPQSTYDERMVDILRGVIETRMTGSGDVASYSIGDRQINMLPLPVLQDMLREYEARVSRTRNPRQYWYKRPITY